MQESKRSPVTCPSDARQTVPGKVFGEAARNVSNANFRLASRILFSFGIDEGPLRYRDEVK